MACRVATAQQSILVQLARRLGPVLSGQHSRVPCSATRPFCSAKPTGQTIDQVQGLFAEARMLLQDAEDSKGTVYFSEDFEDARAGVDEALQAYRHLLDSTSCQRDRDSIRNANDPKMRQLREEFVNLEEQLINDED
jgi:hypothetical protein